MRSLSCPTLVAHLCAFGLGLAAWLVPGAAALVLAGCSPRAPPATPSTSLPAPIRGNGATKKADEPRAPARERIDAGALVFPGRDRVFVPGLDDAVALDAEPTQPLPSYCALRKTGEVVCWLGPSTAQIGNACSELSLPPLDGGCGVGPLKPAPEYGALPIMMDLGCYIRADRSGWCIGPRTLAGLADVVEIAGTPDHGCARTGGGAVWCWGPRGRDLRPPTPVDGLADVVELAESRGLHCARTNRGSVVCWTPWDPTLHPVAGLDDVIDIDLGTELCVVRRGGAVLCGDKAAGPLLMRPIHGIADAIAVESFHEAVCVRTQGGQVRCASRLDGPDKDTAVTIRGAVDVARIITVDRLLCGVTQAGEYLCWAPGPSPEAMRPPELAGIRDLAGRCVVEADGRVSCWTPDLGRTTIFDFARPSTPTRAGEEKHP